MPRVSRLKLPPLEPGGETLVSGWPGLRKERSYTQVELADKIGIIQTIVSAIETNVLKLSAENLDRYMPITEPAQMEGVPFKRIAGLRGVRRLTTLDDANALILKDSKGADSNAAMDLESVPLP